MEWKNHFRVNGTIISNEFIDGYMASANGEYIKEYLYLLRHEGEEVTFAMIADALNHTEADVARALAYWKRAGVLEETESEKKKEAVPSKEDEEVKPVVKKAEARPVYSMDQINGLAGDEDFSQLLYIAQKYMNKVFTPRECEVFAYLYDGLHMTAEMLEYAVEYCVSGGHTSLRYIETVAINWHEKGFKGVDEAKTYASAFTKDSFAVMKAFGLNDRKPGDSEREMIDKWFQTLGFTKELVLEACNRTLETIHAPSFKYADKILSEWRKTGVRTMEDVKRLDAEHAGRAKTPEQKTGGSGKPRVGQNQFQNFPQREIDYDALVLQQLKER